MNVNCYNNSNANHSSCLAIVVKMKLSSLIASLFKGSLVLPSYLCAAGFFLTDAMTKLVCGCSTYTKKYSTSLCMPLKFHTDDYTHDDYEEAFILIFKSYLQNSTHTHVYNVSSEVRDSCETILLEVVAVSDLGWSQAAESRIYLPRCEPLIFFSRTCHDIPCTQTMHTHTPSTHTHTIHTHSHHAHTCKQHVHTYTCTHTRTMHIHSHHAHTLAPCTHTRTMHTHVNNMFTHIPCTHFTCTHQAHAHHVCMHSSHTHMDHHKPMHIKH